MVVFIEAPELVRILYCCTGRSRLSTGALACAFDRIAASVQVWRRGRTPMHCIAWQHAIAAWPWPVPEELDPSSVMLLNATSVRSNPASPGCVKPAYPDHAGACMDDGRWPDPAPVSA